MFFKFVSIIAIPLAYSYTIKVSGKVELGEDLAKAFKEFRDDLLQEGNLDEIIKMGGDKDSITNKRLSKKQKHILTGPDDQNDGTGDTSGKMPYDKELGIAPHQLFNKDIALLDEMVRQNEEKTHVYGKHTGKKRPNNNINV